MLKDKVKELGNKEKSNKKKIENIIFLIAILIATIIIINFILKDDKTTQKEENDTSYKTLASKVSVDENTQKDENDLEQNLEQILTTIKGVGKVNVFINYAESSKVIAMYDEKTTTSSTEETDSARRA